MPYYFLPCKAYLEDKTYSSVLNKEIDDINVKEDSAELAVKYSRKTYRLVCWFLVLMTQDP